MRKHGNGLCGGSLQRDHLQQLGSDDLANTPGGPGHKNGRTRFLHVQPYMSVGQDPRMVCCSVAYQLNGMHVDWGNLRLEHVIIQKSMRLATHHHGRIDMHPQVARASSV